uniref:NADH dehydrogenase subunit 2 n=1 Tax=Haplosymploce aurantiaca TaxID=2163936 RepID=UPI0027A920F1|nr:NADH dehydrogenase subunit 2 [Haplosymploce aurantiaca]WGO57119.1 NADH dehydrogenase subunit 2 [Haplosymploce aurantiaca]
MSNNSTKILFFLTLISGVMITISSNSWLGAWMGLEINLLSFIPIMSKHDNIFTTEASLKYFLVQALASAILLFLIISKTMIDEMFSMFNNNLSSMILTTPLLLKGGAAPFHWWFPSVMEGLSWSNCFILMTIQKIAPLILISYSIKTSTFMMTIIITSIVVGAIGGYNQISIRKILTYSSINHMGWMLSAMLLGENFWLMYFLIYSILTLTIISIINPFQVSFINQTFLMNNDHPIMKFLLFTSLLSLGGLPPFLGFLPKWIIIQTMVNNGMIFLITIMVVMSLITLYYYLRISYSSFMILHSEPSWNIKTHKYSHVMSTTILLSMTSLLGLIMCTILISIY